MAPGAAPVHGHEPALGLELAHGQVLEDALLHVVQPVVVLVEDARRLGDVEAVLGLDAPGELEDGVEPRADPPVSGLCSLVRSSLSISRTTAVRTCSGRSRSSIFAR